MNTNVTTNTDFIVSITVDWVSVLIVILGLAIIGFAIYRHWRKKNSN